MGTGNGFEIWWTEVKNIPNIIWILSFINLVCDLFEEKTWNMLYKENESLLRLQVCKKSATRRIKHDTYQS